VKGNIKLKAVQFKIKDIPVMLWGGDADCVFIAVHGDMSDKADTPIQFLAEIVVEKGYQI